MRPISAYYSIFVAFAHTDAAVLRVRESTAANKLGPAPFETMDKITKQRYKEEEKLDFDMDDWDGYGGIKKGSDLFRCHGTCGTLIQILGRTCQHELAQDFVDYCLGDCKREYPDTVYPSSIKRARECKLKPREKAKPTQPETESSSKPTLVSLPASTAQVSDEASSPSGSATAAPRPQTTPSIPVADEPSATMEPEVTLHTPDTTAASSAFPTHSHPVDDSPDSSRHTSEVQELDGGDAATPTKMGTTATSNVNLTNGSGMRVVNFIVAGAAALTSLILTVVV